MPGGLSRRLTIVVASAVISGGIAAAIAIAFPGTSPAPAAIAQPPVSVVATPQAVTPPSTPAPSPTPAAVAETRTRTSVRSETVIVETRTTQQPSSGSADYSQLPGPAQKAIGDQPGQPSQPGQPDQP